MEIKYMKTKNIIFGLLVIAGMAGCSEDYLTREPYSYVITQAQYEQLSGSLEGSMRGVYSMLYVNNSDQHDAFGKRAIDMYTDLTSSDMALTAKRYGWFYTDEQLMSYSARTGFIWTLYYQMLRNVNKVISTVSNGSDLTARIAEKGFPNTYNSREEAFYRIVDGDTLATYSDAEADVAKVYAQALTMRGYIYSNLANLYTQPTWQIVTGGGTLNNTVAFPLYNERNMEASQPLAYLSEVYTQIESDLAGAIDYFDAFTTSDIRNSKLEVDIDIARGLLAYSYLNKANQNAPKTSTAYKEPYELALKYADDVIRSGHYSILPNKEVLTNGFNDVNTSCWMWGQDVTTETATGLASFFGQVDIHSYSYAWSGDTKVIDENLYKTIPDYDIRKKWFNDGTPNSTFKLCPDKKFFSIDNATSTEADDLDRQWLSDNVFMRIESMYLIAAEASYRLGENDKAIAYLTAITDERVDTAATAQADYSAYKSGLNANNLLKEIEYNWRVEMWGEGYGLQTFLRLCNETTSGTEKRRRGGNHASSAGQELDPTGNMYTFVIPSSETSYNPNIGGTTL